MTYNITFLYPPTLSLANNNSKCVHDRSLSARDIISLVQHYPSLEGRPEQCFFFDTCGKLVSQKKSQQSNVWKTSIFIQITRILYVILFFRGIFDIVQLSELQKQVSKTRKKIIAENVSLFYSHLQTLYVDLSKKTHLSLFSALPVYWWCLQMVSCPSDMNNKLGITVSVGPIDLNDISAL